MTKEDLIDLLRGILNISAGLEFLSKLEPGELETLIACVRDRLEQGKEWQPAGH
jgi:hypothetical protein